MEKIKQMLSNILRLNFCYLKIIHILHPRYHPKKKDIKNKPKNKFVCIHENIRKSMKRWKWKIDRIDTT